MKRTGTTGLAAEMSAQEAQDLVRHCLDQGIVVPSRHFREELRDEGLQWIDAYTVLKTGIIYDPPEENIKSGEWKYRIQGAEPDGKWLIIVFCFKERNNVFLITIFSVKARSKNKKNKA